MGSCDDCPVDEKDNKLIKMFLLSHFLLVSKFEQRSKTW